MKKEENGFIFDILNDSKYINGRLNNLKVMLYMHNAVMIRFML